MYGSSESVWLCHGKYPRPAGAWTTTPNCSNTAEYAFSETVKAGIYDNLEIDFRSIDI
ncbi:hypothetical protein K280104A7_31110 [Candidatus Bariatricus faecipullorum]